MTDTRSRTTPRDDAGRERLGTPTDRRTHGFTPTGRRRNRLAAGAILAALAIGGNLLVYSSLNDDEPVVQVVVDVPAGAQVTADMLRTVDADVDASVNVVAGADIDTLVGRYAKVRLISGSLVTADALQATPLVATGNAVVAIQVPDGALPLGVRERVPVLLVVADGPSGTDTTAQTVSVSGRVVGLPTATNSALGTQSLSVELAEDDAAVIAAADDVRVVLLEPAPDPASGTTTDADHQETDHQETGDQEADES